MFQTLQLETIIVFLMVSLCGAHCCRGMNQVVQCQYAFIEAVAILWEEVRPRGTIPSRQNQSILIGAQLTDGLFGSTHEYEAIYLEYLNT